LLAAARTAAGRSQAEAAACLGLAQTAIAKLEAGSRRLGLLEAIELGRFYGVSALTFDPDGAAPGPHLEAS
jgi:transcriptional regulator with XRE-family HTH domain